MNYVTTETSNQFVQAGFGEGTYGPETLGIIFKPAKWREKKGLPGSTYHYSVPINIYQRMMAAKDIDAYFNDTIKAHPEQYPFTKMEADPQQPSVGAASNIRAVQEDTNGDQPAPVTSLAVIDTLENSALFASGGVTDAQLAAGREWYVANAPKGIETEEKRTALKRFARPLQKLRTGIEARAKEFTGETKRKLAAIDTEKRRLVMLVGGIEDEVLRPLTSWEREEDARKVRLAGIVNELAAKGQRAYMDMAEIEKAIADLRVLKPELERRREADANARELEKLRAESAARAEQDRIAAAARAAKEQAEREAAAELQYAENKRIAAEQEAKRQLEAAELRAVEAAAQAQRDQEAAVEAERKRAADAAAAEYAEMEARAADKDHRTKVNYEAAGALVAECQIDEPAAYVVIEAIAKGLIPHVTINY